MHTTDSQILAVSAITTRQWWMWAVSCGVATWLCYGLAAFAPLPDALGRLLAFAFGPLLMIFSYCFFQLLRPAANGIALHIALLFNLVATALLTLMVVVQQTSFAYHDRYLSSQKGEVTREQLDWIFREVNAIQLGMDLAWDVFISAGTVLFSIAMWKHRGFGRIMPVLGILSALLLFGFNMSAFPDPPGEAGSLDLGPLVALWYLVLTVWIAWRPKVLRA